MILAGMPLNEGNISRHHTCGIQQWYDLEYTVAFVFGDSLERKQYTIWKSVVLDSEIESAAQRGGLQVVLLEDQLVVE